MQQASHAPAISAASGGLRRVRPPTSGSAPSPGAAGAPLPYTVLRRTAEDRPVVYPHVWQGVPGNIAVTDPYVRRFWTAAIGPGAVADLLRLATAARRGRPLRRPVHLATLVAVGLAGVSGDNLVVRTQVPPLPRTLWQRLPPQLRRQHLVERENL